MTATPETAPTPAEQDGGSYDVVIIGAGISGIGAAYRIAERNPGTRYLILERRDRIGGTWDLFRYPGVRSDSSIYALSWSWEPWKGQEYVADGDHIREYMDDTARKHGILPAHPLRHLRALRRLGLGHRHLDRARHRERHTQDLPQPLRVLRLRLLQLRRALHPGIPRHRELHGHRGAPAVLARGPRLHRQEGGGDRQRRHRGVDGAGLGPQGRQGHHAAALTELSVLDAAQ